MTPVIIEALLHYYYHTDELAQTPAFIEASNWLLARGLIEDGTGQCTEKGRTLVRMLLDTPMPEQQWFDPR
jgi:hypothetical protein